jgi:site-specific recombinase XerD
MAYIVTKPPVSETEIEDAINRIASVKTGAIDGVVLSNLVRLCNECGLKKSELIGLSVGDVAKGGVVRDVMRIGEDEIILSDPAKQLLQNHIDYLRQSGYRLYPTYPLFPTRWKIRYLAKTLDNHLKAAQAVEIESQSA